MIGFESSKALATRHVKAEWESQTSSGTMERNVLEYVDHLHEHFVYPVSINERGRYNVPVNTAEGYSIQVSLSMSIPTYVQVGVFLLTDSLASSDARRERSNLLLPTRKVLVERGSQETAQEKCLRLRNGFIQGCEVKLCRLSHVDWMSSIVRPSKTMVASGIIHYPESCAFQHPFQGV